MRRIGPVLAGLAALLLAGCSGSSVADSSAEVEFVPCSETECSGVLPSGAEFEILLPEDWGGSLALFSHGMRMPGDPVVAPVVEDKPEEGRGKPQPDSSPEGPEPAPRWGEGDNTIADVMLQAGYAVAGAAPGQDGWTVRSQIVAAEELYQYFVENVADPNRVYAWGESIGGLTSVRLAELHPEWISGAAALCAPLSGPVPSFDLALDTGFAVRELLLPESKIIGFTSMAEAQATRDEAVAAVNRAADNGAKGEATVLFLASLVGLPLQTQTESGGTRASQVSAAAEGVARLLDQNTTQRYLFEQQVGGNPSGNSSTDYEARISQERREEIDAVSRGSAERLYRKLLAGQRVIADTEAMRAAAVQGELVGDLKVPVLTLHNTSDPVYIVQNQSWYSGRVGTFGPDIRANLVDLFAVPPAFYSADDPAPEGAGNCNFEPRSLVGMVIQLDLWVRRGFYPGRDSINKAFSGQKVTADYTPPPWPTMAVAPQDPPLEPDPDDVYSPPPTTLQPEPPPPSPSSSRSRNPGSQGASDGKKGVAGKPSEQKRDRGQ